MIESATNVQQISPESKLFFNSTDRNVTKNTVQEFNFCGMSLRIIAKDGESWWLAKDVCDILKIGNTSQALSRLDQDEKNTLILNEGIGNPEKAIVNESGLFKLILSSRKQETKAFRKWITAVVLPTIRKTGTYLHPAAEEILKKHGMTDIFNCDSPEQLEDKILRYKSNALVTSSLEAVNKIETTMGNLLNLTNQIQSNLTPEQLKFLEAKKILATCGQIKGDNNRWREVLYIYYCDSKRINALHEIYVHLVEKIKFEDFFKLLLDTVQEKYPILKT